MASVKFLQFIVINEAYGGFDLSQAAIREITVRKKCDYDAKTHEFIIAGQRLFYTDIRRDDPDLIATVTGLGEYASESAKLVVKKVEITVEIESHDGYERIGHTGSFVSKLY